jgi:putative acetyltransferase
MISVNGMLYVKSKIKKLLRVNSDNKDFQGLIKMLDGELNARYGIIQAQYDQYNKTEDLDMVVIGYLDNIPADCVPAKRLNL